MARLVLTAPRPRVLGLAEALRGDGHQVLELPFVSIDALTGEPVQRAVMAELAGFDLVVFVSPTAIVVFFDALDQGWPPWLRPAIVGPGSLEALAAGGLESHPGLLMPPGPVFDAAGLLGDPALAAPIAMRILVVRAEGGNQRIEEELARRGARVTALEAYRRNRLDPDAQSRTTLGQWLAGSPLLVVTTVDAVRCLGDLADGDASLRALRDVQALAIHPKIAESLRNDSWTRVSLVAPGLASLRAALESGPGAGSPQCSGSEFD